jgi:hypothetical protein
MNPELLEALNLVTDTPVNIEYRVYHDEQGNILSFSESNHPATGDYIVLEDPSEFYNRNTLLLRVKDRKLVKIDLDIKFKQGIRLSTEGQPVVKGMAAIALLPTEKYKEIEYYDKKTNS